MKQALAWLASFRLRVLIRSAFLALLLTIIAMTIAVLQDEKQRSVDSYRSSFAKTKEQIVARLHHPAGQLALLNPDWDGRAASRGRPVVLPYAAIDFDDQTKARNAFEMAGCLVQYPRAGSLCVAIGGNPWAGGYVYAAGTFASGPLVAHAIGDEELHGAHRLRVTATVRGQTTRWIAPFEQPPAAGTAAGPKSEGLRGRFTGYLELPGRTNYKGARPVKEFRGWVWQGGQCLDPAAAGAADCPRKSFFSLRLPIEALREALFAAEGPVWPPADLDRFEIRVEVLPPRPLPQTVPEASSDALPETLPAASPEALPKALTAQLPAAVPALLPELPPLFDNFAPGATPPFSLADLNGLLLPGESLAIRKAGVATPIARISSRNEGGEFTSPLLNRLIRRLPVASLDAPEVEIAEDVATPSGNYRIVLKGDARSVNRSLAAVASRVSWFVAAMLGSIALAWLVIEVGVIRRIALLTRRTRGLSQSVHSDGGLDRYDLSRLRGSDELGLLATALDDLLRRVKEDAGREKIRAGQEKDMWHAVGHEIMSPLQSLMALHGQPDDPSRRYIDRMQQAVRVLYGSASPSEAFQASSLQVQPLEMAGFLRNVAEHAGFADVRCVGADGEVKVRADEYPLEDVFAHILKNADRHRTPGTPITLALEATETDVTVRIHNVGPQIPDELIDTIFEYGVSELNAADAAGRRGQGLFVARTYMAKMGGTVSVENVADGAVFKLGLQRVAF
jgi:signal transduction histidine kinase